MQYYIVEFSKYIMAFLMVLYTLEAFFSLRKIREGESTSAFVRQGVYIFIIQFLAYMSMCLQTGQIEYLFFYAFLQIALFSTIVLYQMIYPKSNRLLLNNVCLLLSVSFIMLTRLDYDKATKQFIIVVISLAVSLIIPFFIHKLRFLKYLKWFYGALGILAIGIVLILGSVTQGAKISYTIAGVTLQPSEFVKIIFAFFIASLLYRSTDLKNVIVSAVFAAIHVLILVVSKDLGSAIIFFVGYLFVLFIASRNYIYLMAGFLLGSGGAIAGYQLFSHVRVRVQAFLDPFSVIDKGGYQMSQSLFAIGSGKWFGMGLYQGTPSDIPFVESDFIFSAIGEELGGIFALCLVLVCLNCFLSFLKIAMDIEDTFYRLVACGLTVMYIFQVFLTIGGGIKFIPLTGVTLPLVSYGGSSVLTSIIVFSVMQGLHLLKNTEIKDLEKLSPEEENIGSKKKFNRDIRVTAVLFSVLFVAMMGHYVRFVVVEGQDMINSSYNSRQKLLTAKNTRGIIYSADMEILAETVTDENGKESRYYPYENLFAHVVGYSTKGKTGIEAQMNSFLINSGIALSSKIDNEIAGIKNPGDNVYTSLRTDLQNIASKSLGAFKGAVIVSNVKTGEILAMVSKPDFNPSTIVEDWDRYLSDENSTVLLNRVTQGIYPPGSTFKIITSLAYLREQEGNFESYQYNCTGSYKYAESKITCYHGMVHNQVDFITSFAKSCNCSYANMGINIDRGIYQEILDDVGFNQSLPVEFNYKKSKLLVDESVPAEDMIQISFGQGAVQMTPLHLHLITNAIANGGAYMKPQLISKVVSAQGEVIKEYKPQIYKELMTQEEAEILKMIMVEVVEQGTAKKLDDLKYTAAGKTGSAEYNFVKEDSHAWFTGFAPAEDPEISVTIIVESVGSGGEYAVPIAKRLFDAYFQ